MTYTYLCEKHGLFTIEKSIKDESLKECPDCKGPVKQVFLNSSSAIVNCSGFCGKIK